MSQTPSIPPYINRTMSFILRSPLHRMISKSILLISFTGRNSGKSYTTPVSYSQQRDVVYIFTHAEWWKNLRGGAAVRLLIKNCEYKGKAHPVSENKRAIAEGLKTHLQRVPSDARFYGVTFDEYGNPKADEVENAARSVVMILVQLC